MKCSIKGRFISCVAKKFTFKQDDGSEREWEGYRLTIRDDDAYLEKDQFFTVSVPLQTGVALGMDKPSFEKEHAGKDIQINGVLTPRREKLAFTVENMQ